MAKVALLIGVSEYEPGLPCLDAAVRDIEALRRVLQDPEMGGFDEVKMLANPEAHTMQIEIETLFGGRAKDDLVLLFFSGHGVLDADGTLYFASRNTRKNSNGDLIQSTAVETRFVHKIMNNSPAKRQAIILDCCYSGAFDPTLQPKDDGSVDLLKQLGSEGRVVLTSSNSTERSFEQQGADLSIYTRYLVEGIETGAGDQNGDGFVSMLELHEYAASKVRETAPKMTPKIIVMKDKGFEIVLARAKLTDPKLQYRKRASRYANAGTIRPTGRAILDGLRHQLGLTLEEATEIEAEVLRPYQERLANLQQYRETLLAEAKHEYPLSEFAREDLITLQQMLGLRDEDVLSIQEEVEAQFTHQSEAYQQHLVQYEQALTDAIQREFPFSQQTRQELENLQQSLNLSGDDIARIERPHLKEAELKHQGKLRQEAELQQQEREKAEYENNIRRYEQEFQKALDTEYPLSQSALDGLKRIQVQLKLNEEDIVRIEQPLREQANRKYQEKLRAEVKLYQIEGEQQDAESLVSKNTGMDYSELRNLLRDKQWEDADRKTWKLMYEVAKPKNNWWDGESISNFPIEDLQLIDSLWVEYSEGRYGFSVQKKVWEQCGSPGVVNDRTETEWRKFMDRVGWGGSYSELQFSPENSPMTLPCWYTIGWFLKSSYCGSEEVGYALFTHPALEILLSETTGIDYTELFILLRDKKWKEADEKTAELAKKASDSKEKYPLADLDFPREDLGIIDQLWVKFSNGQYGFSVQKKVWEEFGSPGSLIDESMKLWENIGERVGWGKWINRTRIVKQGGFLGIGETNVELIERDYFLWFTYTELEFSPDNSPKTLPFKSFPFISELGLYQKSGESIPANTAISFTSIRIFFRNISRL